MKHTYPSNQYKRDLQKWKPAKWSTVEQGDVVGLSFRDGTAAVGTVDDHTFDRSVFWLRLSDTGERRCAPDSCCHNQDKAETAFPPPR